MPCFARLPRRLAGSHATPGVIYTRCIYTGARRGRRPCRHRAPGGRTGRTAPTPAGALAPDAEPRLQPRARGRCAPSSLFPLPASRFPLPAPRFPAVPDCPRIRTPLSPEQDTGPAERESLPAHLQSLPAHLQSLPAHLQSLPAHLQPLPAHLQPLPADLQSLPAGLRSLPAELRSLPADLQSLPADLQSLPTQLQSLPGHLRGPPGPGAGRGTRLALVRPRRIQRHPRPRDVRAQ